MGQERQPYLEFDGRLKDRDHLENKKEVDNIYIKYIQNAIYNPIQIAADGIDRDD